jgi:hypothetical protein
VILIHDVRIEHALLLQVMRHCVLRQKGCFQLDFRTDPLTLYMGQTGGVLAGSA